MDIKTKFRSWLYGASAGLLITILIVPTLRGLFFLPLSMLVFNGNPTQLRRPVSETAAQFPDNFRVQLAAAHLTKADGIAGNTMPDYEAAEVSNLAKFEGRYPDNPATYGLVLRWTTANLLAARIEGMLLNGPLAYKVTGTTPPSSEFFAFYDRTAAAGERLDPNNGYFPMLRSTCLFGEHRDKEAMLELHRASLDTDFKEYSRDEVEGLWAVSDAQYGFKNGLSDYYIAGTEPLPELSTIRGGERIAQYKAMQAERSGDVRTGLSIRLDMMRCGDLMRAKSSSAIGSLVGIAICKMSTYDVGGEVQPLSWQHEDYGNAGNSGEPLQVKYYCEYLDRTGYSGLAPLVKAEAQSSYQANGVIERVLTADVAGNEVKRGLHAIVTAAVLMSAVSILLLSWVVSILLQNWNRLDGLAKPLRIATYTCGLLACSIISVYCLYQATQVPDFTGHVEAASDAEIASIGSIGNAEIVISAIAISMSIVVSGIAGLRAGKKGLQVVRGWLKVSVCCAAAAMVVDVAICEACRCILDVNTFFLNIISFGSDNGVVNWQQLLAMFSAIIGPMLVVVLGGLIVAIKAKLPLLKSILVGIRTSAMPLACVLFIACGSLLMMSVRENDKLNVMAQRSFINDGEYYAKSLGTSWPGPLPLRDVTLASLSSKAVLAHSSDKR